MDRIGGADFGLLRPDSSGRGSGLRLAIWQFGVTALRLQCLRDALSR